MQIILNKLDAGLILRNARESLRLAEEQGYNDIEAEKLIERLSAVYPRVSKQAQFAFEYAEVIRFL